MKKAILLLLALTMIFILGACSEAEKETKEVKTIEAYMGNLPPLTVDSADVPVLLTCNMGSGVIVDVTNKEAIVEIWNNILQVKLNTTETVDEMQVDDGSMGFYFEFEDGGYVQLAFCTSEYFYDGKTYVRVADAQEVRDIFETAMMYYDMERETATDTTSDGTSTGKKDFSLLSRDGLTLELDIISNGDEARDVLVVSAPELGQEQYIEGVYEVTDAAETETGWIISCLTGDYYSHDVTIYYEIAVVDGILIVYEL